MTSAPSLARAAPGAKQSRRGIVVDTLEFFLLGGWRRFFERRRERYGSDVFRTNLVQPTTVLLDGQAIAALFASPNLHQDYGFSWARPPLPLVGGLPPPIFANGDTHDRWKALWLDLLRERAETLDSCFVTVSAEFFARWRAAHAFNWRDELESFSVALLHFWLLGFRPDPGEVRLIYNGIFSHLAPGLARWWPRSRYRRSLRAYPRFVAGIGAAPGFARVAALAARHGLSDEAAVAKQLVFLLGMNAYLGTQCLLKSVVGELSLRPEVRRALEQEQAAEGGLVAPAPLDQRPLLDAFVNEVLRLHSPVTFIFGRAVVDGTLASRSGSFAVKAGELLMGVLPFAQTDPALFPDPGRFDLGRYDRPGISDRLIWARGPQNAKVQPHDRTCPGKDVGRRIAKLTTAALLDWEWLLDKPVRWSERRFSLNVAAPIGPLAVSGFRPKGLA